MTDHIDGKKHKTSSADKTMQNLVPGVNVRTDKASQSGIAKAIRNDLIQPIIRDVATGKKTRFKE